MECWWCQAQRREEYTGEMGTQRFSISFGLAAKANVVDPEDFVDALQIVDPINVPDLQPRPVLVMNGMSDVIMVPENAVRLRDSFVLAEQIWTTGGHYFPLYVSEYLLMDYLSKQLYEISVFRSWHSCRCGPGISLHGRGKCA